MWLVVAPCQNLGKTYDIIPRKQSERRTGPTSTAFKRNVKCHLEQQAVKLSNKQQCYFEIMLQLWMSSKWPLSNPETKMLILDTLIRLSTARMMLTCERLRNRILSENLCHWLKDNKIAELSCV